MTDFASVIREKGKYVGPPAGPSMQPLLRMYRDAAVLVAPRFPLKKYDVILYRRTDGKYVLHRIIGVRADGYVLCGDNQWRREFGVQDKQVVGVMEGFFRDETYVPVTSFAYRFYSRARCFFRPWRSFVFHLSLYCKALVKKLGLSHKS